MKQMIFIVRNSSYGVSEGVFEGNFSTLYDVHLVGIEVFSLFRSDRVPREFQDFSFLFMFECRSFVLEFSSWYTERGRLLLILQNRQRNASMQQLINLDCA